MNFNEISKRRNKISLLAAEIIAILKSQGFKENTIFQYQLSWRRLEGFTKESYYDRDASLKYLKERFSVDSSNPMQKLSREMRMAVRSIMVLDDYHSRGTFSSRYGRVQPKTWQKVHSEPFTEYYESLSKSELSLSWLNSARYQLSIFSLFLITVKVYDLKDLRAEHLQKYILSLRDYSVETRFKCVQQLKYFLRFLYAKGIIQSELSKKLPNLPRYHLKLPQVWSEDEVQRLLSCMDRGNPVEKRDYTIFLLMIRLGLRVSDAVHLKFENIQWIQNSIAFHQEKTNVPLVLPLSEEIGAAIIEYMKTARPNITSPYVFLSHFAPHQPLAKHNNLNRELQKYLARAKIKIPEDKHHGVHTLRHTFASNLLGKHVDLVTIAEIIGHTSTNTTKNYLRVDIESLRKCTLNPEMKINE